jgi:hypothetical protein
MKSYLIFFLDFFLLQVSTFFTHSNVEKKLYKNRLRNVCIMYYLKKKVDCLNFDICHRREDLTTSSIVVL